MSVILLTLVGSLSSCSLEQAPQSTPAPLGEPPPTSSLADPTLAQAAPVSTPSPGSSPSPQSSAATSAHKTVYHLLQGKWQSTQDVQSFIELKGHLYIDSYAGEVVDTAEFILDKACSTDPSAGHPGNNARYLVQPKENMCWEIVQVDEESLELSYTARGNSLIYQKVK